MSELEKVIIDLLLIYKIGLENKQTTPEFMLDSTTRSFVKLIQQLIQQERVKAQGEALDRAVARLAVEVMEVELTKPKVEYSQAHLHGIKRSIYLLNELKQSLAEKGEK